MYAGLAASRPTHLRYSPTHLRLYAGLAASRPATLRQSEVAASSETAMHMRASVGVRMMLPSAREEAK